jgi:hypothetical protein
MPSGYTASILLFAGVTDGSGNFLQATQRGYKVELGSQVQVVNATLSAGTGTSFMSFSVASCVPAAAVSASGTMGNGAATAGGVAMAVASDSGGTGKQIMLAGSTGGPYPSYGGFLNAGIGFSDLFIIAAQTLYWATGGGSGTYRITVGGYTVDL